ncbi:BrnT family toxin [Tumidithrix elongata RA019]|uniref:BrnT family toxin n=1 Tax=Tumidithrix elongata BACA0141 TaxID=2716417 RepID=A0AAW9PYY2_9CYAN|nr:BrnT family toxin [Tumidithrix elongata RA019]
MELAFEWDEQKETENIKKHGIGFQEGKTVFNDPLSITLSDPIHSIDEDRFIDLGFSNQGRLLIVVYTERQQNIRIISCRKATNKERSFYEQQ